MLILSVDREEFLLSFFVRSVTMRFNYTQLNNRYEKITMDIKFNTSGSRDAEGVHLIAKQSRKSRAKG